MVRPNKNMAAILAIVGPTAIGKSALALEIARRVQGEIISCDSMQLYRGMDIGTAKASWAERAEIPHHMLDVVSPNESFSCADYTVSARRCLADILDRGKIPVFCGGTGLYLQQTLAGGGAESPPADKKLRNELMKKTADENYKQLCECDPESAEKIHPNNIRRVIRALEIYRLSGIPKSQWDRRCRTDKLRSDAAVIFLDSSDRAWLYSRIDRRVDEMMAAGLLREAESLHLDPSTTAGQAIGYKELLAYLSGECSLEEAVARIKKASRNYAKRQLTWFRHMPGAIPYDVARGCNFENIVNFALSLLK